MVKSCQVPIFAYLIHIRSNLVLTSHYINPIQLWGRKKSTNCVDPSARLGCLHQAALSAERLAWDHRHGAAGPRKIGCDTRVWIQWGHITLAKKRPPKSPKVQDSRYSNLQVEDFRSKTLQLFWVQFLHTMLSPRWFLSPHETLFQWSRQVRQQKACAREGSRRLATGTRIVAADISAKKTNIVL